MKNMLRRPFRVGIRLSAALALASALPGCNGNGGGSIPNFAPAAVSRASAVAAPVVIGGKLLVYLANEATSGVGGTNFNAANGDVDLNDDCAVVVDMTTGVETELDVATTAAAVVGNEVYLIVSEAADSKDWNGANGTADTVLLHYSPLAPLAFVDVIAPGTHSWAVTSGRLYYVRGDTSGLVNGESSLAFLSNLTLAAAVTPVTVLNADVSNMLDVRIVAADEGLLFLTADETVEGVVLNGDGDMLDPFVLHLLDATDTSAAILNVGLSVKDDSTPVRAKLKVAHDWVVGFLVEEATQSNFPTGLNNPALFGLAWRPTSPAASCQPYIDNDTADNVLHILSFAAWASAPLVNPPVNTGLAGSDRVLCTATAVATLAKEADDGGCDLNNDGDSNDEILRWTLVASPALPFVNSAQMNAVEDATPGGTHGVSDLSNRWISVVSESDDNTDFDGGGKTHNLVMWLDPNAALPTWVVDHGTQSGLQPAGASAMIDRPERDRLLVAFQEEVINLAINSGDGDKLDSTPTFARFDPSNANDLDFPGPAIAVSAANPGIVIANGFAMYRVDEAADNRDWNLDGVKDDFVIFRTSVSTNFSALVGAGLKATANNFAGPAVFTGGTVGAAFLANEAMAGLDLNGDGRLDGNVVTWFRIGS